MACEVMNLKLCLLVSANLEPDGRFIDVREVALHEHFLEWHEVKAVKCCCFFCDKPKHSSEVQDRELEVLRRQLPIVGGPRSHPIGGGVVCSKVRTSNRHLEIVLLSEVRTSSRPLETVLLSEEESKELLGIG